MTTGAPGGMDGGFWVTWAIIMAVALAVIILIGLARVQSAPDELTQMLIDELASLSALAVAFLVPGVLVSWLRGASPSGARAIGALLLGFVVFSLVHIGGCELLRSLIYPLVLDAPRRIDLRGAPFEIAKDVVAYVGSLAGFWVIRRWREGIDGPAVIPPPTTFDIQDGARLVRCELGDILAVRAAGNYAEFFLADGRRPLMRAALRALEMRLAPRGFVRTHRGWLINLARVTGLRPEGSGDYAVELGAIEAPLSRRFPEALGRLRSGQAGQSGRAIFTG